MASASDSRLPEEHVPATTVRRLAVTVALVLVALVLANEAARAWLARYSPNEGYRLIEAKWRLLESLDGPVDWLVLGDSSCNQGVDPAQFEARGLGTAVNLCAIGDLLAVNDLWMLERYLERFGPPKGGVVVVHVYDVWHRRPNANLLGKVPVGLDALRAVPGTKWDAARIGQWLVARWLPLYAENVSLQAALRHPTEAFAHALPNDARGFKAEAAAKPREVEKDARGHRGFVGKARPGLSDANGWALDRLVSLSDRHGFPLVVANGPVWEELPKEAAFARYWAGISAQVAAKVGAGRNARALFAEPQRFPKSELVNADHLTTAGAARYTGALLDALAPASP